MSTAAARPLVVKIDATQYPLDVFSDRFISEGFQVVKASTIKEGIKLARRCQPNLILSIDDPKQGIDGARWLEMQHSDVETSLVMTPLLILANADRVERLRIHELPDRVRVLQRPIELRELVQVAQQMLSQWEF